ncbi:MAG: fibronectin type III domain-containing protein [Paludibacteraceae bacterium]|nr:fibronectin type III domain-containing protein [Paludibacteraceae bacterium]
MKRLFSIYVWVAILSVLPLRAAIPYSCSFEEDEVLTSWVLNAAATPGATDQWMIGSAVHSDGKRSLYISTDGVKPVYGSKKNIVVSYLRFQFPISDSQKNYDICFDWQGIGDSATSKLYVMICPEQMLTANNTPFSLEKITAAANNGQLPGATVAQCQQMGSSKERFICGSEQWQNVTLPNLGVSSNNSKVPFALVFIWVNANTNPSIKQTGICIDNLQIASARVKKPQNVVATPMCQDSSLLVEWESTQSEFEVQYRKVGNDTWRRADGIVDDVDGFSRDGLHCSYVLQRIAEGTYDVRVRGVWKDTVSNFSYHNLVLVYCPENHCVDYLTLEGPNVDCTYGYHPNSQSHPNEDPYTYHGVLNYGPESEESRHTIHVDPNEYDPRTDYELPTIPKGALASVRLGDYKIGGNAEAITYTITVDSANQGVLIVKYATVVEYSGHDRFGEPFFRLEVLDEDGQMIDESCGHADYAYSDAVEAGDLSGWHISKSNSNIAWKEWTTVGVNLQPYNGKTVKVRFTTSDCYQTAHLGYAYFTVDCASAFIETENCGSDSKITCHAPEGFAYKWRDENGNIVSEEQELIVDAGLHTYTCRVSFIEDPTCYFEVSTISAPRFPVPEYTVTPVYGQCRSKLRFNNTSHVMNMYSGVETHTHEPAQDCHWYFTRLSDHMTTQSYNWSPLYTCPPHGDTIVVNYTCYIGENNACDSSRVDTIVVPDIIPKNTEFHISTCYNEPVQFGGQWFDKDTTFVGIYPNFAGCDSVSTLYLEVFERPDDVYRHDSICSDSSIMIDGLTFNEPMTNKPFILKTTHGCDSVVYVTLTVNPRIDVEVDSLAYTCADGISFPIPYDVLVGQYDSLQIRFNTPELRDTTIYDPSVTNVVIPYPADILPGHYTATLRFHQYRCGIRTEERPFDIRYTGDIVITQRWNDVLAIRNADYNGGFAFDSVQWYLNDQPIDGATNFNYYAGSGNKLQFGQEYTALLVRSKDGVKLFTCPFVPTEVPAEIDDMPTLIMLTAPMHIKGKGTAYWYDMLGRVYSSSPYNYSNIIAPAVPGCYLLVLQSGEGRTVHHIMVR